MDRLDLHVVMDRPKGNDWDIHNRSSAKTNTLSLRKITESVTSAIDIQKNRYRSLVMRNGDSHMSLKHSPPWKNDDAARWFNSQLDDRNINPRGLQKILRVARTIADIEQSESIALEHLLEAKALRCQALSQVQAFHY